VHDIVPIENGSMAGRTVTVWADLRSIHALLDGHVVRTVDSRLRPEDLQHLVMKGARPAGAPPAKPALRRRNGTPNLPEERTIEIGLDKVRSHAGNSPAGGE
jgi:hypothetical protein